MLNTIILVLVGGAIGALSREFLMLAVPPLSDGFPLDIFVANLSAALLLGWVTALHARKSIGDSVNALLGTGMMGGLSTFSSFVYGAVVEAGRSPRVSIVYVLCSLVLGFAAVLFGLWLGAKHGAGLAGRATRTDAVAGAAAPS